MANDWLERFGALTATDETLPVTLGQRVDDTTGWISEMNVHGSVTHRRVTPAAPPRDPVAVKVRSDVLGEDIWVVADDLRRAEWRTDAPVYTHAELKILKAVGPDTLAWVHTTREMFGVRVVDGRARSVPIAPKITDPETRRGEARD